MADAWETLFAGSTDKTGDAWNLLITQGGGGDGNFAPLTPWKKRIVNRLLSPQRSRLKFDADDIRISEEP